MTNSMIKSGVISVLIFSIIFSQVVPSLATPDEKQLRVAFIGLKFENLPQEAQDIIAWRVTSILESQEIFTLTKFEAARIVYGREKLAELVEKQDPESFQAFAKKLGFAHVFSGKLSNKSQDENNLFLVGELNRYDSATGEIKQYPINIEYEKFGNELVQFRTQYVESLDLKQNHGRNPWSILLVSGIVLGTVLTIRFGFGGTGGDEQSDPETGADN